MPADQIPPSVYLDAGRAHAVAIGDPDNEWYWKTQASMAGHCAAVESAYRAGREAAAQAIIAHADRVAPRSASGVLDAKRRWLHTAAQVAAPTPTMDEIAEALAAGRYVACYLDEAGQPIDPAEAVRRHAATAPRDKDGRWTSDDV